MQNEPPKKTDTQGNVPNKGVANDGKPLSEYEKTLALVERREKATADEEKVLERKEKLASDAILSGDSGGHVDAPVVSAEKAKANQAAEFFKGTALGDAIKKTNE